MDAIRRNIPNAITLLNLAGGVGAIIFASRGEDMLSPDSFPMYVLAYLFIALSALADFLDGLSARLLGAYSALGKELDSLSDLVSFGVAPGVLFFFSTLNSGAPLWISWMGLLIPLCGALRLAKFNTDNGPHHYFRGMPIPANAIFWIGFTWMIYNGEIPYWISVPAVLIVSWMMISPVRMLSLKLNGVTPGAAYPAYILGAFFVLSFLWAGLGGFMWSICFYVIFSILMRNSKFLK